MSNAPPLLHVLIVEDEAPARDRLRRLLERVGGTHVLGEAANGQEALQLLEELQPDVLLVDINMPGVDGLRLVEALDDPPAVIFTTAYEHHALRAFELQATDYLLKPFSAERLERALDRARRLVVARRGESAHASPAPKRIAVEDGRSKLLLSPDDIALARIEESVVFIFPRTGDRLIYAGTLQHLTEELESAPGFLQASRQSIVNLHAVQRLTTLRDGRLELAMEGGAFEQVSRRRARFFRAALEE